MLSSLRRRAGLLAVAATALFVASGCGQSAAGPGSGAEPRKGTRGTARDGVENHTNAVQRPFTPLPTSSHLVVATPSHCDSRVC